MLINFNSVLTLIQNHWIILIFYNISICLKTNFRFAAVDSACNSSDENRVNKKKSSVAHEKFIICKKLKMVVPLETIKSIAMEVFENHALIIGFFVTIVSLIIYCFAYCVILFWHRFIGKMTSKVSRPLPFRLLFYLSCLWFFVVYTRMGVGLSDNTEMV